MSLNLDDTRSVAEEKLFLFYGVAAPPDQTPASSAITRTEPETYTVTYYFMPCPILNCEVVYDTNDRLQLMIPRYE